MRRAVNLAWFSVPLVASSLLTSSAAGQSMNVSINGGPPSAAFGAGAGQTGQWNNAPTKGILLPHSLIDLQGASTTALFDVAFSGSDLFLNDPSTFGDDQSLMDSGYNIGPLGSSQVKITGLTNGTYEVYTHAWTPTHPSTTVNVGVQTSPDPTQGVGGAWPGGYALGTTHAKHTLTITNGQILIDVSSTSSTALVNGFQLILVSSSAWFDVGNALPGTVGAPALLGIGDITFGTTVGVSLDNALPSGTVLFVVGTSNLSAPLFGGVIVPFPDVILPPLPLGPTGSLLLTAPVPSNVPSGVTMYVQGWIQDPGGPQGWAASNAIMATTP